MTHITLAEDFALTPPAVIAADIAAARRDALPPEWREFLDSLTLWMREDQHGEVLEAVEHAHKGALSLSDFAGSVVGTRTRPMAVQLIFGEWWPHKAGETPKPYVIASPSGILRFTPFL